MGIGIVNYGSVAGGGNVIETKHGTAGLYLQQLNILRGAVSAETMVRVLSMQVSGRDIKRLYSETSLKSWLSTK